MKRGFEGLAMSRSNICCRHGFVVRILWLVICFFPYWARSAMLPKLSFAYCSYGRNVTIISLTLYNHHQRYFLKVVWLWSIIVKSKIILICVRTEAFHFLWHIHDAVNPVLFKNTINKAQQANDASMKHMKHMYEAHVWSTWSTLSTPSTFSNVNVRLPPWFTLTKLLIFDV